MHLVLEVGHGCCGVVVDGMVVGVVAFVEEVLDAVLGFRLVLQLLLLGELKPTRVAEPVQRAEREEEREREKQEGGKGRRKRLWIKMRLINRTRRQSSGCDSI